MTDFEKTMMKGMAAAGMAILGFLAIMVINDHATIASQAESVSEIPEMKTEVDFMYSRFLNGTIPSQSSSVTFADSTKI